MGDEMQRYNLKLAVDGKINNKVSMGMTTNIAVYNYDYGSKRAVQESFRANPYWLPYNSATGELNYQPGNDLAPGQASSDAFPAGFSSSVSPIMDAMNANVLPLWRGKIKIVFSQLKESDAAILGASALAWEL